MKSMPWLSPNEDCVHACASVTRVQYFSFGSYSIADVHLGVQAINLLPTHATGVLAGFAESAYLTTTHL